MKTEEALRPPAEEDYLDDDEDEEPKKKSCCPRPDRRITNVLVNPRFHGIPHAFALTAAILTILLATCFAVGWYLSILNSQELCVAETVFSTNDLSACENISYSEQIGYRFNSSALALGTKAYLSISIRDVETMKNFISEKGTTEAVLAEPAESAIDSVCKSQTTFTPSCLEAVGPVATKLPPGEPVDSTYTINRVPTDDLFRLSLTGGSLQADMLYYHSSKDLNAFYTSIVVFGNPANPTAIFDVTLFPVFSTDLTPEDAFQTATADFIKGMATSAGRDDLFVISLKTRFAKCCKLTGLTPFEYFGLLCDYAFLLEGFLALICTVFIIGFFRIVTTPTGK